MKKISIILRLILSIVLIVTSVVLWRGNGATTAFAVGDLTVNWGVAEGNPIFVVNNMIPGDSENRTVNVVNGAASSRPVSIRGLLDLETNSLGSVLEIIISADGTDIYGGTAGTKTVAQFLSESSGPTGMPLTTLGTGADVDYDFDVTFPQSAGDTYQNASIQFDLRIGINVDVPADCSQIAFSGDPIFGTSGNDRIYGTTGNDLIFGLEGNDRILSHGGDDCLIGGLGTDELRGETGNDVLVGGDGNDLLVGAVGNDIIFGGAGNDTIRGEFNNDTIFGEDGDDKINGDSGNDIIHGNNGNDTLDGGSGNDTLIGDANSDKANGQSGIDTCDAEIESLCEL